MQHRRRNNFPIAALNKLEAHSAINTINATPCGKHSIFATTNWIIKIIKNML